MLGALRSTLVKYLRCCSEDKPLPHIAINSRPKKHQGLYSGEQVQKATGSRILLHNGDCLSLNSTGEPGSSMRRPGEVGRRDSERTPCIASGRQSSYSRAWMNGVWQVRANIAGKLLTPATNWLMDQRSRQAAWGLRTFSIRRSLALNRETRNVQQFGRTNVGLD